MENARSGSKILLVVSAEVELSFGVKVELLSVSHAYLGCDPANEL